MKIDKNVLDFSDIENSKPTTKKTKYKKDLPKYKKKSNRINKKINYE